MAPTDPERSRRVRKKRMSSGQTKPFKVIKPKRSKRAKRSSKIRMMNWIKKLNTKYGFESSVNVKLNQTTTKKTTNLVNLPAEVRQLIFSAVLRSCDKDGTSHDITTPTSGDTDISLCCMPGIKAAIFGLVFASKATLADLDHFVSELHLYCTLLEYRKDRLSTVPHVLRKKVVQLSVAETKRADCTPLFTASDQNIQYNVVKLFPRLKRVFFCANIHSVALKTLPKLNADGSAWEFRAGHSRQGQLADTPNAQARYWFRLDTLADAFDGGDPILNSLELSNKDNLSFDEVETSKPSPKNDSFEVLKFIRPSMEVVKVWPICILQEAGQGQVCAFVYQMAQKMNRDGSSELTYWNDEQLLKGRDLEALTRM